MSEVGALGWLLRKWRSARWRVRQSFLSQRFGVSPSSIYDADFFDGPGCQQGSAHAEAVAKILHHRYRPRSVFDFGCGQGALIAAFAELGVQAFGCDGSSVGVQRCAPSVFVFQADLKRPVVLNRRFDLVSCIEVAEHLPRRAGPVLVGSIAAAADCHVVFSAAVPGSGGGEDHINLRPPEYWAQLFENSGFTHMEADTEDVRAATRAAGAPEWFQNTMVFQRSGG